MFLTSENVYTTEQALTYMVECTLATVSSMAMKKSRPKGEYARQISIAQNGIKWVRSVVPFSNDQTPRVRKILSDYDGNVAAWAKQYEPLCGSICAEIPEFRCELPSGHKPVTVHRVFDCGDTNHGKQFTWED